MKVLLQKGNAGTDGRDFRFWFVGNYSQWLQGKADPQAVEQLGLRNTPKVELKWGVHPKGEERPGGWTSAAGKICISLLIRGKFLLQFRPAPEEPPLDHLLLAEGDYVIWEESVLHRWTALEESVIFTVRWSSGETAP